MDERAMMYDDERSRNYLPCAVTEYWPDAARVGGVDLRLRLEIQNLDFADRNKLPPCVMRTAKVSRAWFLGLVIGGNFVLTMSGTR